MKLFSHYKLGKLNPLHGNIKHLTPHDAMKIFSHIRQHHPNNWHTVPDNSSAVHLHLSCLSSLKHLRILVLPH